MNPNKVDAVMAHIGELMIRATAVVGTLEPDSQLELDRKTGGHLTTAILKALEEVADLLPEFGESLKSHPPIGLIAYPELSLRLRDAALAGQTKRCQVLMLLGADVNATVLNGWVLEPALILAARKGHADTCKALIQAGAHVNATNAHGETALHVAVTNACLDVCRTLIRAEADVTVRDGLRGWTALDHAMDRGYQDFIDLLEAVIDAPTPQRTATG